ncbi:hypothetical protein JCM10908_004706 [Rhodotorula pacifica]|uniref:uncharacterized protein n=1 Tax=Rhodotorula pacifica TaxID=1495444 RepID=UPI00316FFA87
MLNRNALLFSPTRDGVPSSDDNFNALDLLAAQDALEAEARDAVPYASECTYDLGYIKQPLYACRTCLNDRAVCVACSVNCHAEHDLIELFNRRDFRCDCGTEGMGAGSCCQISNRSDAPRNERNHYDHNFRGEFCWCGRPYDPHTEENDMIQCLVCEDWCHEPCLMGRQTPASATNGGGGQDEPEEAVLTPDDFDVLICQRCVRQRSDLRGLLEGYAGVEGTGVLVISEQDEVLGQVAIAPDEDDDDEKPEGASMQTETDGPASEDATANGPHDAKRTTEAAGLSAAESRPTKRARVASPGPAPLLPAETSGKTCTAPHHPSSTENERPLRRLEANGARLNVYLQEGWMDRWCRCGECLPTLLKYPYLLEEEDVYEPLEDADASKSTFELGMEHLLTKMPRGQALDSINAFSQLSERLKGFLRPHAEGGTAVTKADIDSFFEAEREQRAERQRG